MNAYKLQVPDTRNFSEAYIQYRRATILQRRNDTQHIIHFISFIYTNIRQHNIEQTKQMVYSSVFPISTSPNVKSSMCLYQQYTLQEAVLGLKEAFILKLHGRKEHFHTDCKIQFYALKMKPPCRHIWHRCPRLTGPTP